MAEKNVMKVFISHTGADRALAEKAADVLRAEGLNVWLDVQELLPGDNYAEAVGDALRTSNAIVVLLTPEAAHAPHVQAEIAYALGKVDYKGRLIPVYADGAVRAMAPWALKHVWGPQLDAFPTTRDAFTAVAQALKAAPQEAA